MDAGTFGAHADGALWLCAHVQSPQHLSSWHVKSLTQVYLENIKQDSLSSLVNQSINVKHGRFRAVRHCVFCFVTVR